MSTHIARGVAAGIAVVMDGKPRAWDRNEELDLVTELDKVAAVYRAQQVKKGVKDAGRANAAAGILNIWNSAGILIFNDSIARLGVPDETHAEQLIVDWTAKIIKSKVGQHQGETINLLIFSQTVVCNTCLGKAKTGVWKARLQAATGLPPSVAIINISTWQRGNVIQPKYVPVFP